MIPHLRKKKNKKTLWVENKWTRKINNPDSFVWLDSAFTEHVPEEEEFSKTNCKEGIVIFLKCATHANW